MDDCSIDCCGHHGLYRGRKLASVRRADPDAVVVNVTGIQWSWKFEYENGVVSDELHLPVGKQVDLKDDIEGCHPLVLGT